MKQRGYVVETLKCISDGPSLIRMIRHCEPCVAWRSKFLINCKPAYIQQIASYLGMTGTFKSDVVQHKCGNLKCTKKAAIKRKIQYKGVTSPKGSIRQPEIDKGLMFVPKNKTMFFKSPFRGWGSKFKN